MNDHDKELIKKVATNVMGWTFSEFSIEDADAAGPYLFFLGDNPLKGTTYPHNAILIENGAMKYGVQEKKWNPLIDPIAFADVVKQLTDANFKIEFTIDPAYTSCTIYDKGSILDASVEVPVADNEYTMGIAVCLAAVIMNNTLKGGANHKDYEPIDHLVAHYTYPELKQGPPTIKAMDWSERPQDGDKIEVYPGLVNSWMTCTYIEGNDQCYLQLTNGFIHPLNNETQIHFPKWRYAITT